MPRALVVGAGISGASAALVLARTGFDVELIERGPELRILGSGITLIAPAVRALHHLGVLEECLAQGFGVTQFKHLDPEGCELTTLDLPSAVGPGGPGMLGMMRPALHDILLRSAREVGVAIRAGTSWCEMDQDGRRVNVGLSDGSSPTYDLVLGSDGVRSGVRNRVFSVREPEFLGLGCYRAVLQKPAWVDHEVKYYGNPHVYPGFTPLGESLMYLYCNVPERERRRPSQQELRHELKSHLAPFRGLIAEVRNRVGDLSDVHYTPLECSLEPPPWNRGRVALVGDAAHAPTPQLAAGGAMCLEDALVLGEELDATADIPAALRNYSLRRFPRCEFVVDATRQLSYWESHAADVRHDDLTAKAIARLVEPY